MVKSSSPAAQAATFWNRFFFGFVDPAGLAFLRIVFGAYLLYYYVDLYALIDLYHFPPAILAPEHGAAIAADNWMRLLPYDRGLRLGLYAVTLASAFGLALGFKTRLFAVLTWLLNRAWLAVPVGTNSGDTLVGVFCFLLMVAALVGHAQAAYSLDTTALAPSKRATSIPAWSLRLFQIQLVYVYFFSGFHKLASPDWYRGEALFYVFQQREWARLNLTWLTHPLPIGLLSYGTLLFELVLFPVLIWVRSVRPYVLVAGVMLHVGIALTMRVFVFGEIMPLAYLSFLEPAALLHRISAWCGGLASRGRIRDLC